MLGHHYFISKVDLLDIVRKRCRQDNRWIIHATILNSEGSKPTLIFKFSDLFSALSDVVRVYDFYVSDDNYYYIIKEGYNATH